MKIELCTPILLIYMYTFVIWSKHNPQNGYICLWQTYNYLLLSLYTLSPPIYMHASIYFKNQIHNFTQNILCIINRCVSMVFHAVIYFSYRVDRFIVWFFFFLSLKHHVSNFATHVVPKNNIFIIVYFFLTHYNVLRSTPHSQYVAPIDLSAGLFFFSFYQVNNWFLSFFFHLKPFSFMVWSSKKRIRFR
jgi:hypothetical protein